MAKASPTTSVAREPHVVIVGAGFGGLSAAQALGRAPVRVTVIDARNYHLFQPLLYQVATAALSPAAIASPIRGILARQKNAHVMLGRVVGIDVRERAVVLGDRRVTYDYLVVATGARHSYFGHDDWAAAAPGLKTIDDATFLRRKILLAFEHAENQTEPEAMRRLMTFVVVGGGPTGVELAGAIAELARYALAKDFRAIDPTMSRIVLLEAGPRILPSFPRSLSAAAQRALDKLHVEVRVNEGVNHADATGVVAGGKRIDSSCVVWAAGVAASPAAEWLDAPHDRIGRVEVGADLTLAGHPEIFVIGDTARVLGKNGAPLPGVAPVAKQQGKYVAKAITARALRNMPPGPFRYRNLGNLATIGRTGAVADFGVLRLSGRFAWLMWSLAHIYFLIGFRNRVAVAADWLWAYLTFQRGARLITGDDPE